MHNAERLPRSVQGSMEMSASQIAGCKLLVPLIYHQFSQQTFCLLQRQKTILMFEKEIWLYTSVLNCFKCLISY